MGFAKQLLFVIIVVLTLQSIQGISGISQIVSSKNGDRLTKKQDIEWEADTLKNTRNFTINNGVYHQEMDGFGGTFMEAGHQDLNFLSEEKQDELLKFIFDPADGVGFSAMKTPIASTDFMSSGAWYSYDDVAGDIELKHFSIARDLKQNGTLSYIKKAQKYGKFKIQSPMDYPPQWMLEGELPKADVQEKYLGVLAEYYLKWVQSYEKEGVHIDYLSLFNEPMDSYTFIPLQKNVELLAKYVGPLFREKQPTTKLALMEMPSREDTYKLITEAMTKYPEVQKYMDIIFYHGYDCQFNCSQEELNFDDISELKKKYPSIKMWMTELCYATEYGDFPYPPFAPQLPIYDFEDGAIWGNVIFSDIEAGASAWVYWNLILNQNGGPWNISPAHNDPDQNSQHPLIIINTDTKVYSFTGTFWFLSHFSKFVRPNMTRVDASRNCLDNNIKLLVFEIKNQYVCNILNRNKFNVSITVGFKNLKTIVDLQAVSITTLMWDDTQAQLENTFLNKQNKLVQI